MAMSSDEWKQSREKEEFTEKELSQLVQFPVANITDLDRQRLFFQVMRGSADQLILLLKCRDYIREVAERCILESNAAITMYSLPPEQSEIFVRRMAWSQMALKIIGPVSTSPEDPLTEYQRWLGKWMEVEEIESQLRLQYGIPKAQSMEM